MYTKLDAGGNDLPDSAASWTMVRDNVTGLIWEVKGSKDGTTNYADPNDADNTYTWYDPNPATNGGDAGTPGDGTDTEDFIAALNAAQFGGHSDWRLPTIKELDSITALGQYNPAVDTDYFPNTLSSNYWSSSTSAYNTGYAWNIYFNYGNDYNYYKTNSYYVRAVRGGLSRSLGHLIISAPAQGETWIGYQSKSITWDTEGIEGNVAISLSREGGREGTFTDLTAGTENDGVYTWTVTGPGSVNCMLKIVPLSDPSKATTQGLFSITGQPNTTTTAAGSITATSATLNGKVNPNGYATDVTFEYGTTTDYDSTVTAGQSPMTSAGDQSANAKITGIIPGTIYHFRIKGVNSEGMANLFYFVSWLRH